MSAPRTELSYLAMSLHVLDSPRDRDVVARAIVAYYVAKGVSPDRLGIMSGAGSRESKLKLEHLPERLQPLEYNIAQVWRRGVRESTDVDVYLSPFNPEEQTYQLRPVTLLWATESTEFDDDLRRYLAALTSTYPAAHGMVGGYRSRAYASREIGQSIDSVSAIDVATAARLHEDGMLRRLTDRRLRRLYPVTIIGPALWAELPPMPTFDPMPMVEELGDCKILRAWPTLCEPRDPAFLRATRELRAWLWPYTIQNPADHVDNDPA